jgi:hypothetical protein
VGENNRPIIIDQGNVPYFTDFGGLFGGIVQAIEFV